MCPPADMCVSLFVPRRRVYVPVSLFMCLLTGMCESLSASVRRVFAPVSFVCLFVCLLVRATACPYVCLCVYLFVSCVRLDASV